MPAYYNEFDPYAAKWLRNLIAAGHIAPGDVDERSIVDVQPDDLKGYEQVHLFAGVGGWSLAARLAGLPDDFRIWTGSCPCQPFSAAGKRKGTADERHLWPEFLRLIAACRPELVFGEQVEGAVKLGWIDGVRADLAGEGYAFGFAVLGAHSVGAPHIRQRLWWVADSQRNTRGQGRVGVEPRSSTAPQAAGAHAQPGRCGDVGGLADAQRGAAERHGHQVDGAQGARPSGEEQRQRLRHEPVDGGAAGGLADSHRGRQPQLAQRDGGTEAGIEAQQRHDAVRCGAAGFWSNAITIPCADGKARRVEPGIFPLAHGVPGRVGKLRAAGNAIVPQVAAEFITAWMEA